MSLTMKHAYNSPAAAATATNSTFEKMHNIFSKEIYVLCIVKLKVSSLLCHQNVHLLLCFTFNKTYKSFHFRKNWRPGTHKANMSTHLIFKFKLSFFCTFCFKYIFRKIFFNDLKIKRRAEPRPESIMSTEILLQTMYVMCICVQVSSGRTRQHERGSRQTIIS